ncbi:Holin-like protein CidA [compost metagenome]
MKALEGLLGLLLFQLLGSAVNARLLPMLPGPILGMLMLLAWLVLRGGEAPALREASALLLRFLPLLLVPPAVGIMVQGPAIVANLWAIAAALVGSLLVGIPLTGWLLQTLIRRQERRP